MSKRTSVGIIYFVVVLMTLLLRVTSALDVYYALGVSNSDAYFTCIVQMVIFGVLPIGAYLISAKRRGDIAKTVLSDFGVKKVSGINCVRVVVLGVCMIICTMGISYVWQLMLSMIGYTRVSSSNDYSSIATLFLELLLTAVLPGVFEEVAHRGLLYAGYRDSKWKFVVVSALLFSLMHQNIVQTGYTFFSGAVMALAMYYTGSIWCGIFLHFLNNAVSVLIGYFDQNPGVFQLANDIIDWFYSSWVGMLVGAILVVVGFGLILLIFYFMRKDAVKKEIISPIPFDKAQEGAIPIHKDIPFILTVLVGVVATIFSLVWGLVR